MTKSPESECRKDNQSVLFSRKKYVMKKWCFKHIFRLKMNVLRYGAMDGFLQTSYVKDQRDIDTFGLLSLPTPGSISSSKYHHRHGPASSRRFITKPSTKLFKKSCCILAGCGDVNWVCSLVWCCYPNQVVVSTQQQQCNDAMLNMEDNLKCSQNP